MSVRFQIALFTSVLLLSSCSAPVTDATAPQASEHVRYSDAAAAQQQADEIETTEAATHPQPEASPANGSGV